MGIEDLVEQEIKEFKERHREDWCHTYFNNFHFRLPDPKNPEGSHTLELAEKIPYAEGTSTTWAEVPPSNWTPNPSIHSTIYLSTTPREFSRTVLRIIKEEGIDIQRLMDLQRLKGTGMGGYETTEKLFELALPIFIKLREMGYNRMDLII